MRKHKGRFEHGGLVFYRSDADYFYAPLGNKPEKISKNRYYRARNLAKTRPNPLDHRAAKTSILPVVWSCYVEGAPISSAKTIHLIDGVYFVSGTKEGFPTLAKAQSYARAAARIKHVQSQKVYRKAAV